MASRFPLGGIHCLLLGATVAKWQGWHWKAGVLPVKNEYCRMKRYAGAMWRRAPMARCTLPLIPAAAAAVVARKKSAVVN